MGQMLLPLIFKEASQSNDEDKLKLSENVCSQSYVAFSLTFLSLGEILEITTNRLACYQD
jgi:hypothetical protein